MIKISKVVEKCKMYQNERSRESPGAGHLLKNLPRWPQLTNFENIPRAGMVMYAWN